MCIDYIRWKGYWLIIVGVIGSFYLLPTRADYAQMTESALLTPHKIAQSLEKVQQHKNVSILDTLKVPPFHKRLEHPVQKGETFCQECHLPIPHTERQRTRAFLNMHSKFIACETCHFRPRNIVFQYLWLDYSTQKVSARNGFFRTQGKVDNTVPLDGNTKIAPFLEEKPVVAFPNSVFSQKVMDNWKMADDTGKAEIHARLHTPLTQESPFCTDCHTENRPLLDLIRLGATSDQSTAIQQHIIPHFLSRYKNEQERLRIIEFLH